MKKFRFLEWQVYKDSRLLSKKILSISKNIPKEHRFEFVTQIIRSSLSVSLNIAEGSGKNSDKELNRFIDIALGSLYETLANADILRDNCLISAENFKEIELDIVKISDQLGGFKKKLKKFDSLVVSG